MPRVSAPIARAVALFLGIGIAAIGGRAYAQEGPSAAVLTPHPSDLSVRFGNSREVEERSVRIEGVPSTSTSPTVVVLGDLVSTTGDSVVPMSNVTATATPNPSSETILLSVTINPSIDAWNAGDYLGSLKVSGAGLQSLVIPVKLSFRSGPTPLGPIAAFLALMLGLGIGALFRSTDTGNEAVTVRASVTGKKTKVLKLAPWLTGLVTVAVIAIVGFNSEYLQKPTFGGAGFSDWLALAAWGFAAGFGGKAVKDYLAAKVS